MSDSFELKFVVEGTLSTTDLHKGAYVILNLALCDLWEQDYLIDIIKGIRCSMWTSQEHLRARGLPAKVPMDKDGATKYCYLIDFKKKVCLHN